MSAGANTSEAAEALRAVERLFAAIAAGDVEGVRAVYAPECKVWHNFDRAEQGVEDNLRLLGWIVKSVRRLRYEEIHRRPIAGGQVVQQHILRGTTPTGHELDVPACMVLTVKDGKITRIEEYLDSAQIAPLLGPSTSSGRTE